MKEIEFGVFPNVAVECDAVSKCQYPPGSLRSFHLITPKPKWRSLGVTLRGRVGVGTTTGRSKGRRYETRPITTLTNTSGGGFLDAGECSCAKGLAAFPKSRQCASFWLLTHHFAFGNAPNSIIFEIHSWPYSCATQGSQKSNFHHSGSCRVLRFP